MCNLKNVDSTLTVLAHQVYDFGSSAFSDVCEAFLLLVSITDTAVTAERPSLTAYSGTEEAGPTGHSGAVSLSGLVLIWY